MAASSPSGSVLLLARAPDAGAAGRELVELLGAERCAALERLMIGRAARWAVDLAPARVYLAFEPGDAEGSLRPLVGDGVELFPQRGGGVSERLRDAAERVFSEGGGPVLMAWPALPCWRAEHAAGALDDLAHDCDISVGPVFDGGFYLLALSRPVPSLFNLPDSAWRSPDAMGLAFAAIHQAGLHLGLLRAERALHRPADVRAALADPLLDPELAEILR